MRTATLPAFAVLLAACTTVPRHVVLAPKVAPTRWDRGAAVIELSQGGLSSAVSFRGFEDPWLVFDVTVRNESAGPVIVSAARFELVGPRGRLQWAVDPEPEIVALDQRIAAEKARHADELAAGAAMDVVGLIGSLGALASDHEAADEITEDQAAIRKRERAHEAAYRRHLDELARRRALWAEQALRKTTVTAGGAVSGRVLFVAPREARELLLRLRVGEAVYEIPFADVTPPPPSSERARRRLR